jgi:hypothetical protein
MRETAMLSLAATALAVGIGLGCALRPKPIQRTTFASVMQESSSTEQTSSPVTKIAHAVSPPEPIDANSTPEAIHTWRRKDKDDIDRRVEALTTTDAENLCFHLRLIPRDEVFDKINVKGRLKRYVDGLHTDEEIADVEAGFRYLEEHR